MNVRIRALAAVVAATLLTAGCRSHRQAVSAVSDSSSARITTTHHIIADTLARHMAVRVDTLTVTVTDTTVVYRAVGTSIRAASERKISESAVTADSTASKASASVKSVEKKSGAAAVTPGGWFMIIILTIALAVAARRTN